jgi:DNA topoisomerase-1
MSRKLVIVESPAKAKTLSRFLGSSYSVKASLGHVRDLPKSQLGVDTDNDFAPKYVTPRAKQPVVRSIKEAAQKASAVYLATDPDREGEAIAWHLANAADLQSLPLYRVVFHEITEEAIKEAFHHPRDIDLRLVDAQQARRILDRLVGYKISPLLWRNVRRGLSAGRVQSVAVRLIVEREREIEGFVPQEYWTIQAELAKQSGPRASFLALLISLADGTKLQISKQADADELVAELQKAGYHVSQIRIKEVSRNPSPPFITSTLQQEAWRKLHFTAVRTMFLAQQLYEGLPLGQEGPTGLITYMRTDSTRVASSAIAETRDYIGKKYGAEFLPARPRMFTRKVKAAQEAHEAIRPTKIWREPDLIKGFLTSDQYKLYALIWKRMVASQMASSRAESATVDIEAKTPDKTYLLRATSLVTKFPGFLILYSESRDEADEEAERPPLPPLTKGEALKLLKLSPQQHFTQPPPRYTEASLIKALEEQGIGRPSTYAPTLSTIQERGYVRRAEGRLHPEQLGIIVNDLLAKHFPDIVDVGFTAEMEEELDDIARGERGWVPVLHGFYKPFEQDLLQASQNMEKVKLAEEATGEVCPQCGLPMVIRTGRFGKFIACSGYPNCKTTRPYLVKTGATCPECGGNLIERRSKKKRTFYGCSNYPRCKFTLNRRPLPQRCPQCGGLLVASGKERANCLKCTFKGKLADIQAPAVAEPATAGT